MKNDYVFTAGCLLDEHSILLTSAPEDMDFFTEYSKITIWNNKNGTPSSAVYEIDDWAQKVIRFTSIVDHFDGAVILAASGKLFFYQQGQFEIEVIDDADNWGYLMALTQIGQYLYACGARGQVYKRVGKNQWIHCDEGILSKNNMQEVLQNFRDSDIQEGQDLGDWLMSTIKLDLLEIGLTFWDIKGTAEDDIYLCGSRSTDKGYVGVVYHYDGLIWQEIEAPETDTLGSIYIAPNNEDVYIGGYTGYLLKGSYWQGFEDISDSDILDTNNEMRKINGVLYMSTSDGLRELINDKVHKAKIIPMLNQYNKKNENATFAIDGYKETMLLINSEQAYLLDLRNNHCEEVFLQVKPKGKGKGKR